MKKKWLFYDYSQAEARVVAWAGPIPTMKTWFLTGEDIHLNVAKLIGKVVEDNKIQMVDNLWMRKPWQELVKGDVERDYGKFSVHSNNYEIGRVKFAARCKLPIKYAEILQNIYHSIFPEIRNGYQAWIRSCLDSSRTIEIDAWGWKRTFYGLRDDKQNRDGYAFYAQSTIGLLNVHTLCELCEVFKNEPVEIYTPEAILTQGYDAQLQVHDSVGISCPDSDSYIADAARTVREIAERPISIRGEPLSTPIDFKTGYNWGELKDYKI